MMCRLDRDGVAVTNCMHDSCSTDIHPRRLGSIRYDLYNYIRRLLPVILINTRQDRQLSRRSELGRVSSSAICSAPPNALALRSAPWSAPCSAPSSSPKPYSPQTVIYPSSTAVVHATPWSMNARMVFYYAAILSTEVEMQVLRYSLG